MKNIQILFILTLLLLLSWSPVMALTIDEDTIGDDKVQFTVTVDEGYELVGFVVGNLQATGATIDWFGEYTDITLIDYTPDTLFTEGQSEFWQTATEYETPVAFTSNTPFDSEGFVNWTVSASLNSGEFFAYYHVPIDEGETPAYFASGIWDVFIGYTQEAGSPIFAALRDINTGEIINVTGETGHTIQLGNAATVPEPNTIALFGLGLLSLAGFNRRKQ